ncbi:MAG TPA: zinc metallopeptidase [Chloroflexi bacterium]|nr:zinc metallopeptidase [Chloroflexota bacterium]
MFHGWNPTYWLFALPALVLALIAQAWVQSAYRKYLRVPNAAGMTGVQAAQRLMQIAGLYLRIEGAPGELSDHYDPRSQVLRLSQSVATRASVASIAIVAHEIGHAQQDAQSYLPLRLRSGLVPVVNFTSWLGPILFLIGLWLEITELAWLGVIAFAAAAVFALVTLPVEIDASRRALSLLEESSILTSTKELRGARQMLTAAALTYVAALAQAVSTLLYYVFLLSGGRSRRRR